MADIPPQDNDNEALKIIAYILKLANKAHYYGVGVEASWIDKIFKKKVVSRSTYYGNPDRYAQGTHDTTIQNIIYDDPYINFILDVFNDYMSPSATYDDFNVRPLESYTPCNTIAEVITNNYEILTDLVSVPASNEIKKYGPVLVTLDWDVALVNPAEAKPIFKYYNIVEGSRGAYSAIINIACTRIAMERALDSVWSLYAYVGVNGAGEALIKRWIREQGGTPNITLMDAMRLAEEQTGLINHIGHRINNQIFTTLDPKSIVTLKIAGCKESDVDLYRAAQRAEARYQNLIKLCTDNPPKLIYTLLSSKVTKYNILGPMTTVTNVTSALNEAGGTSQVGSTSHSVPSESLIKYSSPLKRNLVWPTGGALTAATSDPNIVYSRIQIPTTNWDDIRRVYEACPKNITQASKSYKFHATSIKDAISDFYNSINDLGIRTASMSYDALKEMGTYDVSYTRVT
jgi:hypothetical protein